MPKDEHEECESCEEAPGALWATLTDKNGTVLDRKVVCYDCAENVEFEPGDPPKKAP